MSTLSISSGSSLGSLGSLSASSRGSLTSLGITDIYGPSHHSDVNIRDLHQRVEKLLQGHSISPISEMKPASTPTVVTNAAVGMYLQSVTDSHSLQSLSPHSSLSSLSPPVSPYEVGPPPSYEQHIERHRRAGLNGCGYNHNGNVVSGATPNVSLDHMRFTMDNAGQHQRLDYMRPNMPSLVPQLPQLMEDIETHASSNVVTATTTSNNNSVRTRSRDDAVSNPPLSPISETSSGVCNNLSGGNTRSVSAAVSDESVAGDIDSGVFEVSVKR